jgi:PPOX class probable F420-dependent enzyme
MALMSNDEIKNFLMCETFTAKLATVNKDGSPHVAPIWFVLDETEITENNKCFDIIFTTGNTSTKGRNILRDPRVTISVDDQTSPFSFVILMGLVASIDEEPSELLRWATRIAERYVGKENAEQYGKRNSSKGELLVRVRPRKVLAEKNVAGWD